MQRNNMGEKGENSESLGILARIGRLFNGSKSEQTSNQEVVWSSDVLSHDGSGVVGDSIEKMRVVEEAKENRTYRYNGDAPQLGEILGPGKGNGRR